MEDGTFPHEELPNTTEYPAENPGAKNDFGIVETLDIVETLVKLANAIKASMEDGKFTFSDAFNFTSTLLSLPKALSGLEYLPAELGNLSADEISALVEVVKTELDWADDAKAQIIVEKSLAVGLAIQDLVKVVT